jgi:hypothetical protein
MRKGEKKKTGRKKWEENKKGSGRNSKFHRHCQCESNFAKLGTNLTSSIGFKVLQTLEEALDKGVKRCPILTFFLFFNFFQVS